MRNRVFVIRFRKAFLSVLLMLSLIGSSSCQKKDLFSYTDFYNQKEFEEALDGRTDVLYGYKLHDLTDIHALADPGKDLKKFISEDYDWILAMDQGAWTELKKENGSWVFLKYTAGSGMSSLFLVRTDMLQEHISSLKVKNIIAFRTRLSSETAFVYIKAKEGEFLVPFSTRPDWTEMRNGKLYTREEIAEIISVEQKDMLKQSGQVYP